MYEICKSCGKYIRFIKTIGGKYMPCDVEVVPFWKPGVEDAGKPLAKIVTECGHVLSVKLDGQLGTEAGTGYTPHWATCSGANKHRKPKE
jgi:hypothetical protein